MKRLKVQRNQIFLLSILLISGINLQAQFSIGGNPRSFSQTTLKSTATVPEFSTMSINKNKLLEEDRFDPLPERFSIFENKIIDIKSEGLEIDLPEEKGRLWLYNIESKDAMSLQLFFSSFLLPDGGELFIYNQDQSIVRGAFTSMNNNQENQLMIADLSDPSVTIEYFEPYDAEFEGLIELGSVGLGYKELFGKKSLEDEFGYLNINSPEGEDWQNEKHSVCKITFRVDNAGYLCSGGLLNNTESDGTPYFLTANHCVDNMEVAKTVVTYFNYEIYGGSGEESDSVRSISGASLLMNNDETDFAFLLLKRAPDARYRPYYAPWDATNNQDSSAVGIHHPNGYPKRMSTTDKKTVSYDEEIYWEGGSISPPHSHWEVVFERGLTSGGSSGSPLFNKDKHQVIGQLHGGSSADYYGKFSDSYFYNAADDLSQYLDPYDKGLHEITEGYYPARNIPDPQFFAELYQVCKGIPVKLTGMSAFDPLSWSWSFSPSTVTYVNGTNSNSKEPYVQFENDGQYDVTLEVSNAAGTKSRSFPGSFTVGNAISIRFQPFSIVDSCLVNFDSLRLEASGAQDYLWTFTDTEQDYFYFVNDTMNPVTIKMNNLPPGSHNLSIKLIGSHGSCTAEAPYSMQLTRQNNDSVKHAIQIYEGKSQRFSNKCATVEENEPIPPITSCTGNSWCDEFGTGEDIIGNSVWFYFIPEESLTYRISSLGMDNQIAIYSAESTEALLEGTYVLEGANDDITATDPNPVVDVSLSAGKKYLIQVDGSAGNVSGNFYFEIEQRTGIASNSLLNEHALTIYPQPVNDLLTIKYDGFNSANHVIAEIYDMSGAKIYSNDFGKVNNNILELSFDKLKNGIYFIRLNIDDKIIMKRAVKLSGIF